MQWETVVGLEIHAQLSTQSKIFSGAATAYGAAPNTQACNIDLGLPGVLPVLNKATVEKAVKFGLSIDAELAPRSVFARKNYFYPDLPKGYQISQFELPIVGPGHIDIVYDGDSKRVGITRAHLEEDAGKSLHEEFPNLTGIDLNRAGTPLLEIVSEPDMRSAKEAVAYAKAIHSLVRYLEICDGNMQEGSFRCDANVSIRPKGETKLGTRTEVKNVNSFRYLERAINYEVERQIDVIESGQKVTQETRLFDAAKNETRSMRSKEEATDYRYFPDPDLLPVDIDRAFIESVRAELPELPHEKQQRFVNEYSLSEYDANVLTSNPEMANYFEEVVTAAEQPKLAANWVMGELMAALNKENLEIADCPISAAHLGGLLQRISDNTISGKIAKEIFTMLWHHPQKTADDIIEAQGLKQVSDSGAIEAMIDDVMNANPKQLEQYRGGQDKLFGFFVGQVMKLSKGKANPQQVNELLKKKL